MDGSAATRGRPPGGSRCPPWIRRPPRIRRCPEPPPLAAGAAEAEAEAGQGERARRVQPGVLPQVGDDDRVRLLAESARSAGGARYLGEGAGVLADRDVGEGRVT